MSYITGWSVIKVKAYSWNKYIKLCRKARDQEYECHKASSKRDWPRFWRRKYKAEYRKYYIIESSMIAYFPKSEIERIKTGIVK